MVEKRLTPTEAGEVERLMGELRKAQARSIATLNGNPAVAKQAQDDEARIAHRIREIRGVVGKPWETL